MSLVGAVPALAHHSDAGIDKTITLSLKGTLKQFAWSAPHAQVIVVYQDDKGQSVDQFTQEKLLGAQLGHTRGRWEGNGETPWPKPELAKP